MAIYRNRNTKVEFEIELEYGKQTVEYLVKAEVTPYDPGRTSGPPEKCYPPEGNEVEVKEVYYVDKRVRCPEFSKSPALHFGPFPALVDGQPVTPSGQKCIKCRATGLIEKEFRRPELDDLVSDDTVLEHLPDDCPDDDRPDDD